MSTQSNLQNINLPSDINAEKSILGTILLNQKTMEEVGDTLKPHYFFDERHVQVYAGIVHLWFNERPIDNLTVLDHLKSKKLTNPIVEEVDNDFLIGLISKSSLSISPVATSEIIKNKYLFRKIIDTSDNLKKLSLNDPTDTQSVLDYAQKQIYEISLDNIEKNFTHIREILNDSFQRIYDLHDKKIELRGISTGFVDIDKILGGFHPSDLIILAARPSMGKTSLALEIVKRIAMYQNQGVAIFSLEMSKEQLCDKFISSLSGIDLRKIRSGQLEQNEKEKTEFTRLGASIGMLDEAPIWIDDSGSLDILQLRAKIRRLKTRHNIGLAVIDYLQLMTSAQSSRNFGSRVLEVSEISRGLKMLAKELDIPILALSQLSRNVEGREDKRPVLSDLRDSGSIEQDADIVMFIHREEVYRKETKKKGIADLIISKHRNGEIGTIELAWIGRLATFENLHEGKTRHWTPE